MFYKSVVHCLNKAIRIVNITYGIEVSRPLAETLNHIILDKSFNKSQLAFFEGFLKCFASLDVAYDQDELLECIDQIISFHEALQ